MEIIYDQFNQVAIQPAIDVTFSSVLRNILRQAPDIIMIGEIRDLETATHAVQAALTGHLVFSTMRGALAQRLVRKICPYCRESYMTDGEELTKMGFPTDKSQELYRGRGCVYCRHTGYLGRQGIYEIFAMSPQIKQLITTRVSDSELRKMALHEGMTTLREDAWRKVRAGVTTAAEAIRVTSEV